MGFRLWVIISVTAVSICAKPTPDDVIKGVFISANALKELQDKAHQNENQALKISVAPSTTQTSTGLPQNILPVDTTVKTNQIVSQQPAAVNQQQVVLNQQPVVTNQPQLVTFAQNAVNNQQPAATNQQQVVINQQPETHELQTIVNQQPTNTNQQTVLVNQQPVTNQQTVTNQPTIISQQPTANQQPLSNFQPLILSQGTNPQIVWIAQLPSSTNQQPSTLAISQPGGANQQQVFTYQPVAQQTTDNQQPILISQAQPQTIWITPQQNTGNQQLVTNQLPGTILVAQPGGANQQLIYTNQPTLTAQQTSYQQPSQINQANPKQLQTSTQQLSSTNQQPVAINQQSSTVPQSGGTVQQQTFSNQQTTTSNQQPLLVTQPAPNQPTVLVAQQPTSTSQQPIFINTQYGQYVLVSNNGNLVTPTTGTQTYVIRNPATGSQATMLGRPLNLNSAQNQPTILTVVPGGNTANTNTVLIPIQQLSTTSPSLIAMKDASEK